MRSLGDAWNRYRRENRFLITTFIVVLVLSAGAVFLLQRAQVASPRELTNRLLLFVLWYLDVSLILVLVFILVRNLVRLAVERRSGVLGSRFRTKLVLSYVGLSMVPAVFIFLIATNLLQRSIDRWFSSPVEEVLRGGAAVTQELRQLMEDRLSRQAAQAAQELGPDPTPADMARLQALLGVDILSVYRGPRRLQAVTDPRQIPGSLPPLPWEELRLPGHRADRWRGGLVIRAWAPAQGERVVVVVGNMVPREALLHLERATAAYANFQEMKLQRSAVTSTTALVFLAVTLLLLFATVWLGLYLSRRFTQPLLAVAEATQRVADGDDLQEVEEPASDEVGALVHSFNAMVRRVRATEKEILASHQELATLLATIPTGVLTLDHRRSRFRPNPAAAALLGRPEWSGSWQPLAQLGRLGLDQLHAHLTGGDATVSEGALELEVDGAIKTVELASEPLPGGGWVVALDDLTELVRAQRHAAWSEVARRIAHEIKNPLTPIQLAAERIQRRAGSLDGEVREVLESGCEAIIAHVAGLKELVDAFHQYARLPGVNPAPTLIGRLLREVAALYRGLRDDLEVRLELSEDSLSATVDAALLRQCLVNLIDNAVEAMPEGGTVRVSASDRGQDLVIDIQDSGTGLPTEDPEVLYRPFFSTKGRGSGIGLAMVHRVVSDHGGSLELTNVAPQGARARVILPGVVLASPGDGAGDGASGPPKGAG